ncbi:hypothetical protein GCM10020254_72680 [Streptomyces goshikiensis]
MKVADVDGVRLAGFLIDAGPVNSPSLLEVGPAGARTDHAANPTTVQDVFLRVGGAGPGRTTVGMVVNSHDTIVDHTWIWRADHGDGVGWETNRADYGFRVNGDDVLATGLFVEHFNKYDVEWNGERGRTVFFQNEKAYDAPQPGRDPERRDQGLRGLQGGRLGQHPRGLGGWAATATTTWTRRSVRTTASRRR